jgi:hypothetical protein
MRLTPVAGSSPALHVFYQGLLAVAARHVEDIQRRRIGQGRIGRQPQSFQVANRRRGLALMR